MKYDRRLPVWTGGNEGFVGRWYRDPANVPTIGFGFTWGSKVFREWWLAKHGRPMQPGDTISKPDAIFVMGKLIDHEYGPPVAKALGPAAETVSADAASASIDMFYNAGIGSGKWKWFAALKRGDIKASAALFRKTATTAGGRQLPGLVRRRAEGADIMEHGRWPLWVIAPISQHSIEVGKALPDWQIDPADFQQALAWLKELGFYKGPIPATRGHRDVKAAVLAFQTQHPQLDNDAVLGRATFAQLQRVIDLRAKATKGAVTTGTGGAAGAGDVAVNGSGYGDWIMWGALGAALIVAAWLAWTYRDELKLAWLSVSGKARNSVPKR